MEIALAHDYLTQRGGAERVVLSMARAFPQSPVFTTLYHPEGTFPEFDDLDIRPSELNRNGLLRRHHRLALPFLARDVSRIEVDADVLLTSSSGWAHGIRCTGRKIVYCHAPARWLYQTRRYAGGGASGLAVRAALAALGPSLRRWDSRAAASADEYVVNSTVIQRAVRDVYGIEAEVLPPPPALMPAGEESPPPGVGDDFVLCVARLMPYKNVDAVVRAVLAAGGPRLVVVGEGPDRRRLDQIAEGSPLIRFAGRVTDAELRWLYRNCRALVAASYEDYGLSPLEAGAFGKPAVTLRDGGFLDTVVEGETGAFFDAAEPSLIAEAIGAALDRDWDAAAIAGHVDGFSESRFIGRLHAMVSAGSS